MYLQSQLLENQKFIIFIFYLELNSLKLRICKFTSYPQDPVPVIETEVLPAGSPQVQSIPAPKFEPEFEDRIETEVIEPPELPPPPPGEAWNVCRIAALDIFTVNFSFLGRVVANW